jgi:hypothetical protein
MISEEDKSRARRHLGYLGVSESATFDIGIPAGVQTQFSIEAAFNKLLPSSEAAFRMNLDRLDAIECQIAEGTESLEVTKLGNLELRPDAFEQIMKRYAYWQGNLANLLSVMPNPWDARFGGWLGQSGQGRININVDNG